MTILRQIEQCKENQLSIILNVLSEELPQTYFIQIRYKYFIAKGFTYLSLLILVGVL